MGLESLRAQSNLRTLLPFGKALYREQALAIFRLIASLTFVAVFPLIAPLAGEHVAEVRFTVFCYALASLVILARVFVARPLPGFFLVLVHGADLLWPALICLFTGCSNSPFLLLFIFAILAAPYRHRPFETLAVTLSSILIVRLEAIVAAWPAFSFLHLLRDPLEPGLFTVRSTILLLLGGFLAYTTWWTGREQQAYATRSILKLLHADAGLQSNLREILPALLNIFEAQKAVLVLRNSSTWRVIQWGALSDNPRLPIYKDVPASEEDRYFWQMPQDAWSIACSRSVSGGSILALDRQGSRLRMAPRTEDVSDFWHQPFRTLLATDLRFGGEWSGRVFLLDAPCTAGQESCLRLLQQIANEVGPVVYHYYLWKHTSIRVRAIERQKIARDLHDGVVQSLIAMEMQFELIRRERGKVAEGTETAETLVCAQELIRAEVRKLRCQIEQLRSTTPPRQVLPRLSDMLKGFQDQTGIVTTLSCNVRQESIPREVSGEVVRIIEEALSNVRKHSGAKKVEVRLMSQRDVWEIVIQDDGRGFDFTGRLSLAQLEAERKGPRVIRERVHSFNGDLTLESYPNRGARLEIRFAANT